MTKERLSKLQKDILKYLIKTEYTHRTVKCGNRFRIMRFVAGIHDKNVKKRIILSEPWYTPSANFRAVFSQSIRNLHKKGLIELIYKYEIGIGKNVDKKRVHFIKITEKGAGLDAMKGVNKDFCPKEIKLISGRKKIKIIVENKNKRQAMIEGERILIGEINEPNP